MELEEKLSKHHNFHLALKAIQINNISLLHQLADLLDQKQYTSKLIVNSDHLFEDLQEAYTQKVSYVLIDESVQIMLPLVTGIYMTYSPIIFMMIPLVYCIKDNREENKILHDVHEKKANSIRVKSEDFLQTILSYLIKE